VTPIRTIAAAALLFGCLSAAASAEGAVFRLTLKDAIDRALAHNVGAIVSREAVREAEAERDEKRGALLPSLTAGLSGSRQTIDLEAYGFPVGPGGSPIVGPFNVFDTRLFLAQPLLDLGALARARSETESLEAARLNGADVRDQVVLTCVALYIRAAIGARRIEAVRAQEAVAQSLYERAQRLKDSGVVAGIEVIRAKVQLEAQRQRVLVSDNDFEKDKLALARAIGLSMSEPFELADSIPERLPPPISVEEAMAEASAGRSDLLAADAQVRAGEETVSASRGDRWPTIRFSADYGLIGSTVKDREDTFSIGVGLRVPLFEGGQARAREARDRAKLLRLRAERDDLRARIELEVRSALLDFQSGGLRLTVARSALELAEEQLRESEDRFGAGAAGNLEVVQAQDAVATASDNLISATLAQCSARFALARAVGGVEHAIDKILSDEDAPHE
jgi:outer membrane protein TolC